MLAHSSIGQETLYTCHHIQVYFRSVPSELLTSLGAASDGSGEPEMIGDTAISYVAGPFLLLSFPYPYYSGLLTIG
jgi:hypothetical protein